MPLKTLQKHSHQAGAKALAGSLQSALSLLLLASLPACSGTSDPPQQQPLAPVTGAAITSSATTGGGTTGGVTAAGPTTGVAMTSGGFTTNTVGTTGHGTSGGFTTSGASTSGGFTTGTSTTGISTTGGITGAGGAGGVTTGQAGTGSGTTGGTAVEASFETVKYVIQNVQPSCAAADCHGNNEFNNLNLVVGDELYSNLTTTVSAACGNVPVVNPGNPAQSALVMLLKGPCGQLERMPRGCIENEFENNCVPNEYIQAIEQWIADGAPEQ